MDMIAGTLAAKIGINKREVKFLTKNEVENVFLNRQLPSSLNERLSNFAVVMDNGSDARLAGDDAQRYVKENVKSASAYEVAELKGQIAYRGVLKGVVKIVREMNDIGKVNMGDILVSPATNPNLLPAMQKAGAFVTDVGGITCHAAIVAREMKKPCVIGTKFATQIFKDGDMVEVDAEKGIVRKLS